MEEETRKCIEIYITKRPGQTEETVEFKNVIKDIPENEEWFKSASDIMKQVAYVLYKIHENDIDESEVTYANDREGETSESIIADNSKRDTE